MSDELDRPTGLQIAPDVRARAESIVRAYVQTFEGGGVAVYVDGLTQAIADALQLEVNRSELAEIERRCAVENLQNLGARIRELGAHVVVESWAMCSRCGVRAPSIAELPHRPGCTLSTRPPPRLSLVAPVGSPTTAEVPAPPRVPTDGEPPP